MLMAHTPAVGYPERKQPVVKAGSQRTLSDKGAAGLSKNNEGPPVEKKGHMDIHDLPFLPDSNIL